VSELSNLSLFVSAIAKVLLMTGLGMGGVVALGFEKVSRKHLKVSRKVWAGQLGSRILIPVKLNSNRPTSPARKAKGWRTA
jgi:hypothetical protein